MFTGDINQGNVNAVIAELFRNYYNNPDLEVTLYISSLGGDIDSAIRFYDFVKSSGININTVGFGQIDSAAIIMFLTGKERTLIENCRVRLHAPAYNAKKESQVISVINETAELLNNLNDRYFQIFRNELKQNKSTLEKMFNNGKILSVKEAIDLKIATKSSKTLPVFR